jgi:glycosyltransferase involved in cell wall biosynthesis
MTSKDHFRDKNLRILMVSQRMLPYIAGAELQALHLARALIQSGNEVRILTTKFMRGLPAHDLIAGVPVRRIPVLHSSQSSIEEASVSEFPMAKASNFASMAAFTAFYSRSFDIVHAHCLSASSLGAAFGASLTGVPIIVKPSLGGDDGEIRKIMRSPAAPFIKSLLNGIERFAILDEGIAEELESAGVSRKRFVFVENGVDTDKFCPANADERADIRARLHLPEGPIALFVGQLIERKGIKSLLEAWRIASPSLKSATLVFAGEGEESEAIQREAASGLRIISLGVRDDVADLMRASDVLILPSRNESFGNVVVEAMACGLPVIVSSAGIAQRLALDRVAGRVVTASCPEEIAAAVTEIFNDPEMRKTMGERSRYIVEKFDFRLVATEYLKIYRSIIEENR